MFWRSNTPQSFIVISPQKNEKNIFLVIRDGSFLLNFVGRQCDFFMEILFCSAYFLFWVCHCFGVRL